MGKVLKFSPPSQSDNSSQYLTEAHQLMMEASALLHQGEGEVEREVAWLLEDLVEFLNTPDPGRVSPFHNCGDAVIGEFPNVNDSVD